jgi:TRAP-type C4-dicarboxylate transport system substrate-binding protein
VHVLSVFTHGPGQIYNTKHAVTSLKDLEGLKIRVGGGIVNDVARALGSVPMLKPAPESYELLSQGVADGLFFPKESPLSFKLVPLIKHVTYVPGGLYSTSFAHILNPGKWAQISEADKTEITSCRARCWHGGQARHGTQPTRAARRRCARPTSRW